MANQYAGKGEGKQKQLAANERELAPIWGWGDKSSASDVAVRDDS
jgi:hypothetical protein